MTARLLILTTVAALWPVLRWTVLRALDGSDAPWGVVAWAALGWMWLRATRTDKRTPALWLPSLALLAYALAYPFALPLIRGVMGMTALALLASQLYLGQRFHLGVWGVCLSTLPLEASLQFYLGYPLRRLVGELAAGWLRLSGVAVRAEGVALVHDGRRVIVDAPCSGIKMLWVGGLVAALLLCARRLSPGRQVAVVAASVAALLFANVVRAAALFYAETLLEAPGYSHDAVGVVLFALALGAIVAATFGAPDCLGEPA